MKSRPFFILLLAVFWGVSINVFGQLGIKPKPKKKSMTKAPIKKKTEESPKIIYDEIDIGHLDTAQIGKPTKVDFFEHLDMFRKTRWDKDAPGYDTATGNGFYGSFFKGDFDVSELPASYKGEKFVILGVEVLKNKNTGQDMNIMYLHSDLENAIIWVDFDKAVESGEIKFIPRKIKK